MTKTTYKDLSWPLKVAVVVAWVVGLAWTAAFMLGFVSGLFGV